FGRPGRPGPTVGFRQTTGTWMMRRFESSVSASRVLPRLLGKLLAGVTAVLGLTLAAPAEAQEIQITGPLVGQPAVRWLRLHRRMRFELAPSVSFTLLDQYERTIMPGGTATFHFTDWIGVGVFGGYGLQYTTGLSDELQTKAIDSRDCAVNKASRGCRLTA